MNVTRNQFRSQKSGKAPWYEVEVQNNEVVVTDDKDGSIDVDTTGKSATVPDHVDLPDQASANDADVIGYVVTQSGEILAIDSHKPVDKDLRAHIGWYHSSADTLELVEFVE